MTELELKAKAEELEKLQKQYQDVIDKSAKERLDALEQEKQDKIISDIIAKLHPTETRMVFGKPKADEKNVKAISFGTYLKMVKINHPEILKTVMSEGTPADGGYTVPQDYGKDLSGTSEDHALAGNESRHSIHRGVSPVVSEPWRGGRQ